MEVTVSLSSSNILARAARAGDISRPCRLPRRSRPDLESRGQFGHAASIAVPGSVAGAGMPALVIVGGYIWLAGRKQRSKDR